MREFNRCTLFYRLKSLENALTTHTWQLGLLMHRRLLHLLLGLLGQFFISISTVYLEVSTSEIILGSHWFSRIYRSLFIFGLGITVGMRIFFFQRPFVLSPLLDTFLNILIRHWWTFLSQNLFFIVFKQLLHFGWDLKFIWSGSHFYSISFENLL